MSKKPKILITGASGFIGHHLARYLCERGYWVRGVDIRKQEFPVDMDEFVLLDLRERSSAEKAVEDVDWVFHLACNMGGMGFISENYAEIFHGNSLLDLHMIEAARAAGVKRYFYASTACVYPEELQNMANVDGLKEDDIYPANPQGSYGMEKFMGERLAEYYRDDYDMDVKIVRFHNVYGPECVFDGGREKAPAALSRKVASVVHGDADVIEIWGDGKQTRSFLYIDDALRGILKFMKSSYRKPLNIGSDRMVTMNEVVDILGEAAGLSGVKKKYVKGPQGVRGRCSSNERVSRELGWKPKVSLEEGLKRTYEWIEGEMRG